MRCADCQRPLAGPPSRGPAHCPRCQHERAALATVDPVGRDPGRAPRQRPILYWRVFATSCLIVLAVGGFIVGFLIRGVKPAAPPPGTLLAALAEEPTPSPDPPALQEPVPDPVETKAPEPAEAVEPPRAAEPERRPAPPPEAAPPLPERLVGVMTTVLKEAIQAPPEGRPLAEPIKLVFKRRSRVADEELLKQLVQVPELSVQSIPYKSRQLLASAPKTRKFLPEEMPDFAGLPMRMGVDCQLGKEAAEHLHVLSRKLRTAIAQATPKDDTRPDAAHLKTLLEARVNGRQEWLEPEAIPTLTQMLMAENRPLRLLLVELLDRITGSKATAALTQRALFDTSCEVREAAVRALADRPAEEFQAALLDGLRYPWAPVADHAAEALVALRQRDVVPTLVKLLHEPDPSTPFASYYDRGPVVRELVRVNHLSNCTLCHANSVATNDPVRGLVPSPSQPLPPPVQYYDSPGGPFVRADVTYLQQDFSVPQPVAHHGPWPASQRFDYLVRNRLLTNAERSVRRNKWFANDLKPPAADRKAAPADEAGSPVKLVEVQPVVFEPRYEQREAVLFALRELTGQDGGDSLAGWMRVLARVQ